MPDSIKKAFMDFGSQTGIFAFFLMVIAAPILEELIFRGIILDGLLKKYSPIKSILISSLLFGLVHLNPWQFVTGLIVGIFSGWVYYRTRSLSFSIIIHAAANLSGFLMRYFIDFDSSMDDTLLEMYGGVTNLILAIVGSVLIVTVCIYYLRKEFERGKMEMAAHNK
jgi:membrane protease YdiL (CAAX protease family)